MSETGPINPEAVVLSVTTAIAAKDWAQLAFITSLITLIFLVVVGGIMIYVAARFHVLEGRLGKLLRLNGNGVTKEKH